MKNKLDSFNKDKFKCKKCKIYFDENDTVSSPTSTLCKNCHVKWKQYWFKATRCLEDVVSMEKWYKLYDEFIDEKQT